jgi:hypothetical protein
MGIALLGANLGAGGAAYAQFLMCNGHDLLFVLLVIIVVNIHRNTLTVFGQAHQFEHAARADFETAAAANAFLIIQR